MVEFSEKQKENLKFFKDNLNTMIEDKLLKDKYVVIHDKEIKATFDTFDLALNHAIANFPRKEFIIQQVISTDSYINYLKAAI